MDVHDGPAVQRLAHGLKSSSANVGALALAEFCKQMELMGRSNTIESGLELFTQIKREYTYAKAALEAEL